MAWDEFSHREILESLSNDIARQSFTTGGNTAKILNLNPGTEYKSRGAQNSSPCYVALCIYGQECAAYNLFYEKNYMKTYIYIYNVFPIKILCRPWKSRETILSRQNFWICNHRRQGAIFPDLSAYTSDADPDSVVSIHIFLAGTRQKRQDPDPTQ